MCFFKKKMFFYFFTDFNLLSHGIYAYSLHPFLLYMCMFVNIPLILQSCATQ